MSCLECLEQTEGRVYDLEGKDCIILARVRRLLCVASMDDWSLLKVLENNAAVLQLEAVVPQGTSWRDFHAFAGRYHKSQFETAVGDLGMLRAAWESAAEVSLPICRLALYGRSATGGDFLDFVNVRGCP